MHFTLTVALPQGESVWDFLDPYCEMDYQRDDDWKVIWPDGTVYNNDDEVPFTFYDWLCLGWRRDGYIKWKRWSYPEIDFEPPKDYPEINWKWRWSAFIKKYIKWFGFDDKKLSKYPQTHAYITELWEFNEYPEHYQFLIKRWETHEENEYDEEAFEKAKKDFNKRMNEWYKSIPDDYVIYLIDYHI